MQQPFFSSLYHHLWKNYALGFFTFFILSLNYIEAQIPDAYYYHSDNIRTSKHKRSSDLPSASHINSNIAIPNEVAVDQFNGFCEGFESGSYLPEWQEGTGMYTRLVTDVDPAVGTYCFENTSLGSQSFYSGVYKIFAPIQPTRLSWYAKTNNTTDANGYFVAGDANINADNGILFCYFNSTSHLRFFNITGYNHPITANTWYHIEARNIDYINRNMDIYVDDVLILDNWAFRSSATSFDRVHLFNLGGNSTVNYDQIEFGEEACLSLACPSLTTAPPNVTIINSTCGSNCMRSGGIIMVPGSVPSGVNGSPSIALSSPCPAGSTLQYNVNGTGWTATLPAYAQDGPSQTIITRCNCDIDNDVSSPTSDPLTTAPGECFGNCGFTHNSGSVGGCASTANITSTDISITSTNCYYPNSFTSDALAFAQYELCGNGSITTQVTSITGGLGWAGVTMRQSNASGAKKAQLMTNLSTQSRREFRTTTNGAAYPQQFPSQNRYWLRITRTGNQFVMFISPNGASWYPAGSQNIIMGNCIEVGLVVTNYTPNSTVTATFANVTVTGGAPIRPSIQTGEDILTVAEFSIMPNPTTGLITLDLNSYSKRQVQIELYNLQGKLLQSTNIETIKGKEEIDLTAFANGMYLIRVRAEGLPDVTKRVVVNSNQ